VFLLCFLSAQCNFLHLFRLVSILDIQAAFIGIIIALFALAPVAYVATSIKFWNHKQGDGVNYFSLLMFSMALYSFGYFLEVNATNPETAFFIRNFEYLGTVFVPTFCMLFIAQNTKLFKITAKIVVPFVAVSATLWILYVTNPYFGLFYNSIEFVVGQYGGAMLTEKSIGFYLLLAYYSAQIIISGVLLYLAVKKAQTKIAKRSFRFLFFTFQSAWIAVAFILLGLDEYVDPTPLALMIIGGLFVVNEIYNDMFQRSITRWQVSYMPFRSPAFLFSTEGVAVCINDAGKKLLEDTGKDPREILSAMNEANNNRMPVMFIANEASKWLDVKTSVFNVKGTLISYSLTDITGEKNASIMAELFFNAISDYVFVVSRTGEILFANDEFKNGLGYDDGDIKRMKILDIHPADRKAEAKRAFEQVLMSNESSIRIPLLTKSGAMVPVETRVWLGDWNGEPVVFGMSKDITIFEESEEKFKKSFYKNPAIMAITDVDSGEYIQVNEAFLNMLGYTEQEVLGRTGAELGIFVDINQRINAKKQLLLNGEFTNMEVDVRSKTGDTFKGLFSGGYITAGNSSNLLTVMIDVTENRKKDKLLGIITSVTQEFLKNQNFLQTVPGAFALFGEALDVNRIFLVRCEQDENGGIKALSPAAEWCSTDMLPITQNPEFLAMPTDVLNNYLQPVFGGKAYVSDVSAMPTGPVKEFYTYLGVKTVLTTPVFNRDTLWGVVCLHECRREREWTDLERNTVSVFVDSLSMAIQGQNNLERIEFLSFHDHLTGMFNRRYFEREVLRLDNERYYPLSMLMADVNGLKLINDAFGHNSGDLLLRRFADILSKECRAQDVVARIGGDEFVVLLPNTNKNQALVVIERINTAIAMEHFENLVLSASIGLAVKIDSAENMDDVFKQAEDEMYRNKLSESSSVRSKTIDLILNSLFEKNGREMQHSNRVGNLCESVAKAMKFSKDETNQIRLAGLMHDIGKIGISEESLNKSDNLLTSEWVDIKRHSEIGYRILGSVSEFSRIADYVLEHHERPDGRGYPKGLKNDEISVQAKIISLADSYDAMTSERTYRKILSKKEAVTEIKKCCGTQFDPEIAKIFVEVVLGEEW
jgi:diguanylate cyclase (GGDEF)-like protein/PAS domain S-box-containing protein/putative nucleotidyltransferase with HDIG domain